MKKYIMMLLTALTLTLVSGQTFAGCFDFFSCSSCCNGCYTSNYDYGYYYDAGPVYYTDVVYTTTYW
jgi:hypothetical protein